MLTATAPRVTQSSFGATKAGVEVRRFVVVGAGGLGLEVIEHGASIRCLCAPDRWGRLADVMLGYPDLLSYEADPFYLGAVVGRSAGRIRGGAFELDGVRHQLSRNGGEHHLHGGVHGFDKAVWRGEPFTSGSAAGVVLRHLSPDRDEGYPGTLEVSVTYTVTPGNVLSVDYRGVADLATPVSLTQHSYFNLAGEGSGDVLGHELTVFADRYTPLAPDLLPTGAIAPVEGTPLDFREAHLLGERIGSDHEQLRIAGGYDHNFVLGRGGLVPAARLVERGSGRTLEVHTTQPGMQLYTGNFLDGALPAKRGRRYRPRAGVCLETQHFPDAPNQPAFPSSILRPGEELRSRTEFRFGVLP